MVPGLRRRGRCRDAICLCGTQHCRGSYLTFSGSRAFMQVPRRPPPPALLCRPPVPPPVVPSRDVVTRLDPTFSGSHAFMQVPRRPPSHLRYSINIALEERCLIYRRSGHTGSCCRAHPPVAALLCYRSSPCLWSRLGMSSRDDLYHFEQQRSLC